MKNAVECTQLGSIAYLQKPFTADRLRAVLTARRNGMRARGWVARLPRDAAWRTLRLKEWAYTLDLLMGWQDEGRSRPAFTQRLFDLVFSGRGRRDSGRRA